MSLRITPKDIWTEAKDVNLSEVWKGDDKIPDLSIKKRLLERSKWVNGRPTKIQKTARPDSMWLEASTQWSKKQEDNVLQTEQKKVPNCMQHAATGNSTRNRPMTNGFNKVILTLEKDILRCRAFEGKTVEENVRRVTTLYRSQLWDTKKILKRRRKMEAQIHFTNLMDLCHSKNAELAKHPPKIQRVSCALGNIVNDEEGCRTAFADQCASASWMASAKFLDTLFFSKLLGMAGAASDSVLAYNQVETTEPDY